MSRNGYPVITKRIVSLLAFLLLSASVAAQQQALQIITVPSANSQKVTQDAAKYKAIVESAFLRFKTENFGDWRIRFHEPTGLPASIYGGLSQPLRKPGGSEKSVREFLRQYADLLFLPADLVDLRLEQITTDMLGNHVRFQQTYQGLSVYTGELVVHVTPDDRVFLINNNYYPEVEAPTVPLLSKGQAVEQAYGYLGMKTPMTMDVSAELVIFPYDGEYKLAWKLALATPDFGVIRSFIDAETGKELQRYPLHQSVTGSGDVYLESPAVTPRLTNRSFENLDGSGFLKGSFANVLLAAGQDERGRVSGRNNVQSSANSFKFPEGDTRLAEAMMYYHVDNIHGYFKSAFNYTGRDQPLPAYVRVFNRDGTALNNAFFNPQQQAIVFGTSTDGRDYALDSNVIYHEYTHSVVDTLNKIGDNGSWTEARAMNEALADYFSATPINDPCLAEYASSRSPGCMRDLTNRKHYPEGVNWVLRDQAGKLIYGPPEEHFTGEMWGAALWDMRIVLGQQRSDQIVFASLSLLPQTAGFADGLIALISADQRLFNSADTSAIRRVFNARGITEQSSFEYVEGIRFRDQNVEVYFITLRFSVPLGTIPTVFFRGRTYLIGGFATNPTVKRVALAFGDQQGNLIGEPIIVDTKPIKLQQFDVASFDALVAVPNVQTGTYTMGAGISLDGRSFGQLQGFNVEIKDESGPTPPFTPETGGAGRPNIANIAPSRVSQGSTVDLVITGSNFSGRDVRVRITPQEGITINRSRADSPNQITANITIGTTAAPRDRQVNVIVDNAESNPGTFSVVEAGGASRNVLPTISEREPNNGISNANSISEIQLMKGTIDPPGDIDRFRFRGRKDDVVSIEIFARRIGSEFGEGSSKLDSNLFLLDSGGRFLIENDDIDLDAGIFDSRITSFKLPGDDDYDVILVDFSFGSDNPDGGPDFFYYLKLTFQGSKAFPDTSPPAIATINSAKVTNSTTALAASWSSFDIESGVSRFEYAIGTTPGGTDVLPFTFTTNAGVIASGLNLTNSQTYFFTVKAINGAGLESLGTSGGTKIDASLRTLQMNFPFLVTGGGLFTGFALANKSSSADAEATFTAYDNRGNLMAGATVTNPKAFSLRPGRQLARFDNEIFGSGIAGSTGWVEVTVTNPDVVGFFEFGDFINFLDGVDVKTLPLTTFLLPKVKVNQAKNFSTAVNLVNPNPTAVDVTVELYRNDAAKVSERRVVIPPKGRFFSSVADLFGVRDFQGGYIVGRATGVIAALEVMGDLTSISMLTALDPGAASGRLVFAQLATLGGYETEITIANLSNQDGSVILTALSNDGNEIQAAGTNCCQVKVPVPAGGQFEATAREIFGLSGTQPVVGYLVGEVATGSGVLGTVSFGTTAPFQASLTAVAVPARGQNSFFFSHVAQTAGFWTGITMVNANPQAANVTIEVFDIFGKKTGSANLTLRANEKIAKLVGELVPAVRDQVGGYIKITSSQPLISFELLGDSAVNYISAVPPQ